MARPVQTPKLADAIANHLERLILEGALRPGGKLAPEGLILRYVFLHSIGLASLVGILVTLQAYVWPFVAMVVR